MICSTSNFLFEFGYGGTEGTRGFFPSDKWFSAYLSFPIILLSYYFNFIYK